MTDYVYYEKETGRIIQMVSIVPHFTDISDTETHAYLKGSCVLDADFVQDGAVLPRPKMSITLSTGEIAADMEDTAIISGILEGAAVTSNSQTMVADGSDMEFVTDVVGVHKLNIALFPYLDAEVIINAI